MLCRTYDVTKSVPILFCTFGLNYGERRSDSFNELLIILGIGSVTGVDTYRGFLLGMKKAFWLHYNPASDHYRNENHVW